MNLYQTSGKSIDLLENLGFVGRANIGMIAFMAYYEIFENPLFWKKFHMSVFWLNLQQMP